jgi:hypothetical protein
MVWMKNDKRFHIYIQCKLVQFELPSGFLAYRQEEFDCDICFRFAVSSWAEDVLCAQQEQQITIHAYLTQLHFIPF